jgi:hypothetical protein
MTAPGNEPTVAQRQVADIWRDLLDVTDIAVDDDFFELGGSSLLLVRLADRLSAAAGAEVELIALFSATTVRAQALLIDQSVTHAEPVRSVPPIQPLTRPRDPR